MMDRESPRAAIDSAEQKENIMLLWYNLVLLFAASIGLPYLMMTLIQPKRRATFLHRLGWAAGRENLPHSYGQESRPIWVHALSVGEVLSAEPIVDQLAAKFPNQPLVFSVSTHTGMNTAHRLLAGKVAAIFYYPYDLYFSVQSIAKHVRPKLVVIVETDIWPNFQLYMQRRGVPVLLVNARLSIGSFRGYGLLKSFSRKVMASFKYIGAQTESDAERFIRVGAPPEKIVVTGNVKFAQKGSNAPLSKQKNLRTDLGVASHRPIIIMGSTHRREESIGLEVFKRLKQRFEDLLLIVAPRDPGRADSIGRQLREHGLAVHFLPALTFDKANNRCDALVVNTIGILRRLYAIADVAFIGGSLVPEGGHNPLEPAAFGKPIVFGPDMSDFAEVAQKLTAAGGAIRVRDGQQLYDAISGLLSDEMRCRQVGRHALGVFRANQGALDKTMEIIIKTLKQEPPNSAPIYRES
jgi:3-deoxy-D-manno-octulosonic-acid transferase